MSDAFSDCANFEREERRQQQRIALAIQENYRNKLNIENQIQTKLHKLMDQNKPYSGPNPPFFYLLEIDKEHDNSKQKITCKLVPADKYSLDRPGLSSSGKNNYEHLYGSCLTQKMIPKEDLKFEFSDLELVLTVYEGNIYPIK